MRGYWQSTSLGWTIIATMFAVAILELPLAPVSVPAPWNGEGSIEDYLLLPALLLICAALGNLLLRAVQKGRGSALPG